MVKIDNKQMFNKMNPRKMEKIQIYPSKQHCGYNKMTNQLPKLTKTIMSPLTTMPPKKMMIAPQNGVTIKPNLSSLQTTPVMKVEANEKAAVAVMNSLQMSAMKNNFAAKISTEMTSTPKTPPIVMPPAKSEAKVPEKVKDITAASYRSDQISLDDVHPYITCFLCRGYLIEATTIVECLHTYCHSCLMKHLAKEKCCPQCDMSINKSKTNIK
jgi:polycomb group RING finger protein 4